jgi:hypothetical protein
MHTYRLILDIPLTHDLTQSKQIAEHIIDYMKDMEKIEGADVFQYRLSHDSDRGNKNYFDINENGHCTNKKIKVELRSTTPPLVGGEER